MTPSSKAAAVSAALLVLVGFLTAFGQEPPGRSDAILAASRVVDGDYFAVGELVEISGTINGDLYAAGGQVVIDGQVNGDVLVAGGRVSLSGAVTQDVRVAGGNVVISGNVGRNLTVAGGNVELAPSAVVRGSLVGAGGSLDVAAPVSGGARLAAGTLVLASRIAGGVKAAVGTLRITSRAEIGGDVVYWSGREASVSEEARIAGKLVRNEPPETPRLLPTALFAWLMLVAASFVSTLILGLLSLRFLPAFHRSVVDTLRENPWASLGIGFITAVVLPVACVVLFLTLIAFPLALVLLAAFFVLLYWARIYVISWIGEAIVGRLGVKTGRIAAFLIGLFVYYFLIAIPVAGWIVAPLAMLFGTGAELKARKEFYVTARKQDLL